MVNALGALRVAGRGLSMKLTYRFVAATAGPDTHASTPTERALRAADAYAATSECGVEARVRDGNRLGA